MGVRGVGITVRGVEVVEVKAFELGAREARGKERVLGRSKRENQRVFCFMSGISTS